MSAVTLVVLAVTSLVAATVNGALGYGYSSISVPVALLVTVGRILNPALVIVEVVINLYSLFWNRSSVGRVIRRVLPLAVGLVPGVIAGALLLGHVAPSSVKLFAFCALLPLILLQASGRRWPIRNERQTSVPLGAGVGVLYGLTTISGPPLALFWNNQGLAKNDFKVALAVVRSIESVCALLVYSYLGLITKQSTALLPWIAPGVLIGFPVGHMLVNRIGVETFRRVCMSFDAYLVSFGLARTLDDAGVLPVVAYQVMVVAAVIDTVLLWSFFRTRAKISRTVLYAPNRASGTGQRSRRRQMAIGSGPHDPSVIDDYDDAGIASGSGLHDPGVVIYDGDDLRKRNLKEVRGAVSDRRTDESPRRGLRGR